MMNLRALSLALVLGLVPSCDKAKAIGEEVGVSAGLSAEAQTRMGEVVEKTAGELVAESFKDPEVSKRMDAAFENVFQDPEVDASMQRLIEACMAEAPVQAEIASLAEDAVKDPEVAKKIQQLIAGASSPAEIEARMEKHTSAAFESPAVTKAIESIVEEIIATPEIDARLNTIFAGADLPPGFVSRDLAKTEKEFEASYAKADAAGKREAFLSDWSAAAKKDPAATKAAREMLIEWSAGLEKSKALRNVVKGGLESARTKNILAKAIAEVLSDPEVKASAKDLFRAVMLGAEKADLLAEKSKALFGHKKVLERMQRAVLELLQSEAGSKALKDALLAELRNDAAGKKLQDVVHAMLAVKVP
jgi:hypothetical protein